MSLKSDHLELGQFIPLHYHYNMLNDTVRMQGFKKAIDLSVTPGAKVLELGGGTGVLSFFAAKKASQVWCVERNPELVNAARNILTHNPNGSKIEVVQADAEKYLPPEPVDVVICEMLHTGLLREKQLPMIAAFKTRYLKKFGGPLPTFIPEACIQAVQLIQQNYFFEGFYAPTFLFQDPTALQPKSTELSNPEMFQLFSYEQEFGQTCSWDGEIEVTDPGHLNSIRMITKNILGIDMNTESTVDWHTQHIIVPLPEPIPVARGDKISVRFNYQGGDPLSALTDSLRVQHRSERRDSQSVA